MVRVDLRIEFVETEDVRVERNYTIELDTGAATGGSVTFETPFSIAIVLDDLERGSHTLTFTIETLISWHVRIWAWRQEETSPPFKALKDRIGGETLIGEGEVTSDTPLIASFEAIPGPPVWAPGRYYKESLQKGLINLILQLLGLSPGN